LKRSKKPICQLLNVHGIKDTRQTDIHTPEPLISQPKASHIETATEISENIQTYVHIYPFHESKFCYKKQDVDIVINIQKNIQNFRVQNILNILYSLTRQYCGSSVHIKNSSTE
jgi:hypothetical protein